MGFLMLGLVGFAWLRRSQFARGINMKRHHAVLLCGGVTVLALGILKANFISFVHAQAKAHVEVKVEKARPEDVGTPEAIVLADLASISGGVGVARQWGRDSSLMDPHVRFVSISVDKTGKTKTHSVSQQEYIDQSDGFMVKEGFTEHELGHQVHRYGNVATVLSAYEGKMAKAGKPERGVNIYQLYN